MDGRPNRRNKAVFSNFSGVGVEGSSECPDIKKYRQLWILCREPESDLILY